MSFATWNCASLFGAIAAGPQRRRHKWHTIVHLIGGHDLVGFQETRGGEGDLATLPSSHIWFGTFMAFSTASGGSAGGGCIIGMRRRLQGHFPRICHEVRLQGRAHALLCLPGASDDGLLLIIVHMESASPISVRKGVVDDIAALVARHYRCIPVAIADWNFVHADDPRVDLRRLEEVAAFDPLASHFERRLSEFIELEQAAPTRRQMSDGVAVSVSRLDRLYARICPAELGDMVIKAMALGDMLRPSNPSGHIPVSVRISAKRRRDPRLSAPIAVALCRSSEFSPEAKRLIGALPDGLSAFVHYDSVLECFREAARRGSKTMAAAQNLPAALQAQTALGVLRASRRSDAHGVGCGVRVNPDLSAFVDSRMCSVIDPVGLLDYVRSQSMEASEEEEEGHYIAESATPENQKRQKVEGTCGA